MAEPHEVLAGLAEDQATAALFRCCGAPRWVEGMRARLPFVSTPALLAAADEVWQGLGREDYLEAFSHHPRIGADLRQADTDSDSAAPFAPTAAWARDEQAGAARADHDTREQLRLGNAAYAERFGFTFIVCATGKSAGDMLALLRTRLANHPDAEIQVAAREQARITRLRLEKLGT